MRRRAGMTLIELLVVMVMTAFLAAAIGFAFQSELTTQRLQNARRAQLDRTDATERAITRLLQGARLAPSGTNQPAQAAPTTGATGATAAASGATPAVPAADVTTFFQGLATGSGTKRGSDRLTFTTTAPGVPMAALSDTEDFETQQETRGPVGGLAEVSLSTTPVGDAGGRTGLFERIQRPSDTDPTQGGTEFVLDPDIATVAFQFWNGLGWVPTWDTTNGGAARLPRAVQVSYTWVGESEDAVHVFVVPIPTSDASGQNPVVPGGGS